MKKQTYRSPHDRHKQHRQDRHHRDALLKK